MNPVEDASRTARSTTSPGALTPRIVMENLLPESSPTLRIASHRFRAQDDNKVTLVRLMRSRAHAFARS